MRQKFRERSRSTFNNRLIAAVDRADAAARVLVLSGSERGVPRSSKSLVAKWERYLASMDLRCCGRNRS